MNSEYKYLKFFPRPFLEVLIYGRVLPIIGAGFSKNAIFPTGKSIPDWDQLGREFADSISGYNYNGAIDAISAYQYQFSRVRMIEKLTELLLTREIKPGDAHKAFCRLPFQTVATTNFDFLLEQAYSLLQRYCRPVIEEEQLAIANGDSNEIALFKIHGDLHHPKRIVATEEDYDGFLNRYPMLSTYLANLFISKTIIFIGYSLDDPDLRQVFQMVKDRLGSLKRKAYTLRISSSGQDTARFNRRDVQVINIPLLPGKSYSTVFEEVFEELRHYWVANFPAIATITEEDPLMEFSASRDGSINGRLVYFSLPRDLISIYKKYIFPIVEAAGFAPITSDDILGPNAQNNAAKVVALIERSSMVVVHIDNFNPSFELNMALSIRGTGKKIRVIVVSNIAFPDSLRSKQMDFILENIDIFKNIDEFSEQFEQAFEVMSSEFKEDFKSESRRLLDKREYKAAIISAITQLESRLRNNIDIVLKIPIRTVPLTQLLKYATEYNLLDQNDYMNIKNWMSVRNQLVHLDGKKMPSQAKLIVDGVHIILEKMDPN
ncbi:SIR2 family NAD-dependent protein deacylase [Pedobacter sp. GR22-10]|uniref:SIR2 family NAD-dependent protein deacylase n=1 Tax=Pedobacter sp. GR22-10 TaxID=2994472 RepID=UPI0022460359|nr:SIR2 family protein [Pedobacter sp. GR22-10]MCX2430385.1 SIR2 family protein [Pedobacter sp. GR22-10]